MMQQYGGLDDGGVPVPHEHRHAPPDAEAGDASRTSVAARAEREAAEERERAPAGDVKREAEAAAEPGNADPAGPGTRGL
jgi:hypothetical protein